MTGAKVGDPAPDFELPATGGETVKLSSLKGKVIVLVFYPGDFTPVCTKQLCSYRDDFARLAATGARILGISTDTVDSHEKFKTEKKLPFPLLSDGKGEVSAAYGLAGILFKTKRALIVVDREGVVRYRKDELLSLTYRSVDEIREAVSIADHAHPKSP